VPRWQRALITGASSGIGEQFAQLLAEEGSDLVLVARREHLLHTLAERLRDAGIVVEVLCADLADRAQLDIVARRVLRSDSPIDLVVNNAGVSLAGRFHEQPLARHEELVAVCAIAPMVLTHAAMTAMSTRSIRGSILNVSSVCGSGPVAGLASYSAAKGFVNHLSQAAAADLGPGNVTITTVMPGPTRTAINDVGGTPLDTSGPEWMDPRDLARQSLDAADRGLRHFVPGYANRVRTALTPRFSGGVMARGRYLAMAVGRRSSHAARRLLAP
jgi:short-subunit dehydrogenase